LDMAVNPTTSQNRTITCMTRQGELQADMHQKIGIGDRRHS
jgi:hypothetical protein